MLPAGLVNIVSAISELRERETKRKDSFGEIFDKLESIAKVQSVKGSNEIEGIVTSEQRINEIVNQNSAPLNHNEAEIAGYRDALDLIHTGQDTLDIRERDILRLHEIMLSYSPVTGGRYKENDNVIMEVDASGARRVRFSPTPAEETPEEMEQLVLAYMDARGNYGINQLLLIPCFILDFLCIHPFPDGNGRMSRLLTLLLMYKSEIDVGKYISYEEQINESKDRYYEALRISSDGWHTNNNDYVPFTEFFILMLFICYRELDRRFDVVGDKKASKGNRIEAAVLKSIAPMSKKDISEMLPDISITTIEAKLSELQKQGKIIKIGGKKDARYVRK